MPRPKPSRPPATTSSPACWSGPSPRSCCSHAVQLSLLDHRRRARLGRFYLAKALAVSIAFALAAWGLRAATPAAALTGGAICLLLTCYTGSPRTPPGVRHSRRCLYSSSSPSSPPAPVASRKLRMVSRKAGRAGERRKSSQTSASLLSCPIRSAMTWSPGLRAIQESRYSIPTGCSASPLSPLSPKPPPTPSPLKSARPSADSPSCSPPSARVRRRNRRRHQPHRNCSPESSLPQSVAAIRPHGR